MAIRYDITIGPARVTCPTLYQHSSNWVFIWFLPLFHIHTEGKGLWLDMRIKSHNYCECISVGLELFQWVLEFCRLKKYISEIVILPLVKWPKKVNTVLKIFFVLKSITSLNSPKVSVIWKRWKGGKQTNRVYGACSKIKKMSFNYQFLKDFKFLIVKWKLSHIKLYKKVFI